MVYHISDDISININIHVYIYIRNIYNMTGRVVSDIQTRAEGELWYI